MDSPVAPGDILLGKYRVERVLGQGGMGVVVAARHVELGQLYAIKFLLPAMLSRSESLERFVREARAAARLGSEHVAKVHDVGRMENGAPYMVMEYLDGSDLKALITKQGALSVEDAVTYVLQTCDAIAEAHEAGIIHRDLKPANLFLVRRRNGTPCIKVLDFGISKRTGGDEVDLTHTNAMFGSPLYMSPEQMTRTKTVDLRTDIWAIGVILHELLAGESPFKAFTMPEVVSRVLQEEPAPLRERRPDVPPAIEAVITRCLRKRREERFQTVEELAGALMPFRVAPPARGPLPTGEDLVFLTVRMAATSPLPPTSPLPSTVPLPSTTPSTSEPPAASGPVAISSPPQGSTTGRTGAAWGHTASSLQGGRRIRLAGVAVSLGLAGVVGSAWWAFRGSPQAGLPASAVSPPGSSASPLIGEQVVMGSAAPPASSSSPPITTATPAAEPQPAIEVQGEKEPASKAKPSAAEPKVLRTEPTRSPATSPTPAAKPAAPPPSTTSTGTTKKPRRGL